jgi:hypothetical protein
MKPKDINKLLEATRDQRFRKVSERRIESYNKIANFQKGQKRSEQTRERMQSAAEKRAADPEWQRKQQDARNNFTEQQKQEISRKISENRTAPTGPMSEAQKQKIRATREQNGNTSSWNKGVSPSDSTRKKLSEANRGKTLSKDTRKRIGANHPNRKAIMTPYGRFDSRSDAARYVFENGLTNNTLASMMQKILKLARDEKQPEWYYID